MPETPDGLHPGTSREAYERIEAVNYSTLKHFARSPAHARAAMLHPPSPSEEMDLGTAVHARLLEPDRFRDGYVVRPKCDRRTTAGKLAWQAFEDKNRGKAILGPEEMGVVREIGDATARCGVATNLLASPGVTEVAVVWTDRRTGLRCKALVDRLTNVFDWTIVLDLKTTQDASERAFQRSVATFQYHEQAAFYLDGLDTLMPRARRFLWLVAETKPPYCTAIYEPSEGMLRVGRAEFESHLLAYQHCREHNNWPGYPSEIKKLHLPKWANRDEGVPDDD